MRKVLLTVVMFVMVFATVPVFAGMPVFLENSYVVFRAGIFSPNGDGKGLKDFDTGYNVELAYGYEIMPNLVVEGGIGRYSTKREESGVTLTASAIPITATAKGILPLVDGKFELSGGAGIGLYMATMEAEAGGTKVSNDANAFGFHLVGGADYNLSEHIAIGGEVKWISVTPDFNTFGSGKMGGLVVNAGLKYKF